MSNSDKLSLFIDELKTKNDIVSIISRYVTLERKGRSFWGRCPFHGEKTPSFTVNDYDQFYHCFGCGAGGDVIKFVQEIESVDFMGAIHILADLAHMEVPSFSNSSDDNDIRRRKEQKDKLLSLMKDTAHHYVDNLKAPQAKAAIEYFSKRNITPAVARMFGLGYSKNQQDLVEFLKGKGYTIDEMVAAGVVKLKNDMPYDPLGGRVIYPIIDTSSNVIAFGGRTLDPKPAFAKYLNTSETVLFSKSKTLYALNLVKKAKQNSAKIDYLIVVEGYMDVISLHKAGFISAVASMGTALTTEQAKLLKRFSEKVYICYDGDAAGKKATLRGLDILRDNGLDVYVMSLPEGLDPDDVINKYGEQGYQKLIDRALPLIDFKLEFLQKMHDLSTSEGKTKFVNEALEVLNTLGEVEREVYVTKVSELSGIMKDFIRRQLDYPEEMAQTNVANASVKYSGGENEQKREKIKADTKLLQAEKFVLSAMLHSKPYAYSYFTNDISKLFTENRVEFYKTIKELSEKNTPSEMPNIFYKIYAENVSDDEEENKKEHLRESASEIINYIVKNQSDDNDLAYFKDCLAIMYTSYADREISRLSKLLETEIDKQKRTELLSEISRLMKNKKTKTLEI